MQIKTVILVYEYLTILLFYCVFYQINAVLVRLLWNSYPKHKKILSTPNF